ncbi:TPA: ribosome recycling factor [Candidatus Dependentiae bacterium]|nr:MAG: Ribosome-recycling factor [candidate division TM6 bacterium GW2011_GWF2_43_87]HBL98786.1 ribosome recycling factor [Candidatus Dependentiae bacterium]
MSFTFSAEDNPQKFEQALRAEMQKHLEYFEKELSKIRTGRANPALVEDLHVNCYGSSMRLKDLATITTPEAQLIVIQPWDQGNIEAVERAISQSELHLNPVNDGILIRLQLPPMSAARREELVKTVSKKLEECKIALRNVRRDFNNLVRDLEKNKSLSEDIAKRLQTILQKVTDDLIGRSDVICTKKEAEIKTS